MVALEIRILGRSKRSGRRSTLRLACHRNPGEWEHCAGELIGEANERWLGAERRLEPLEVGLWGAWVVAPSLTTCRPTTTAPSLKTLGSVEEGVVVEEMVWEHAAFQAPSGKEVVVVSSEDEGCGRTSQHLELELEEHRRQYRCVSLSVTRSGAELEAGQRESLEEETVSLVVVAPVESLLDAICPWQQRLSPFLEVCRRRWCRRWDRNR